MKIFKGFILVALLCGVSFAAGRNINGSTGYIIMPTAEGLRFQEYSYGLNAYSGTGPTIEQKQHWKYFGALGTSEGSELSVMGRSEREGLFLNTKWFGTLGNYDDPLLVGIGFENVSSQGKYGDHPNMFMVVTKKFLGGNSFSVGSTGRYINKEIKASMLAGIEIFTTDSLSWLVDMNSYDGTRYNGNVGLRVYSTPSTYFSFSVINAVRNETDPLISPAIATIGLTMNGFM